LTADSDSTPDLWALVRTRLQTTVPSHALQVLQAAAVLGESATFPALQATSGRSEAEVLDALDALDAAAVLVAQDHGYRFVHPLVATVVRADLRPARRAFLHRRAAEVLERTYAPHPEQAAALLMGHYAAAGDLPRAAQYAEHAAEQALRIGAFVEAAAYARRALDWEPRAQRQFLLGEALIPGGSAGEAQAPLQAALRGFEQAGDVVGAARVCLALAQLAIGTGQPEVARTWLEHASVQQLEALEPALCTQALIAGASVERQRQAYDVAVGLLDRAGAVARDHQLAALEVQVAFERGNLLANRGDLRLAVDAFGEALRLADATTNVVMAAMAWNNLAYHTLLIGDVAQAQQHIAAAMDLTERYALSFLWQYVWSTAGEIALARGDLSSADAAFGRAFEVAQAWDNQVHMANVRINQALVAQARNETVQARALVEAARDLFGASADPFVGNKIERVSRALA
jgi:tetratricopeptide (TPR) repeat protein